MNQSVKVAVIGAGVYGATIAIQLARAGCRVTLFDRLGLLRAASAINQFRVHRGYHYPRSAETIRQILQCYQDFISEFSEALVQNTHHWYAIPHKGSSTSPEKFEQVMREFCLPFKSQTPSWINFEFIEKAYQVEECVYDPDALRQALKRKLRRSGVKFEHRQFEVDQQDAFDYLVFATYGASGSHLKLFEGIKVQVAEKVLIELPSLLQQQALVVVDGPFTAFDPYGSSGLSLFGSGKLTNHWSKILTQDTASIEALVPEKYQNRLNLPRFTKYEDTHFYKMREDCAFAVPLARQARYLGSNFTLRVVEYAPGEDRRILRVAREGERKFYVFSGKVVACVEAARQIERAIIGGIP